jgi:hypothetical protein
LKSGSFASNDRLKSNPNLKEGTFYIKTFIIALFMPSALFLGSSQNKKV